MKKPSILIVAVILLVFLLIIAGTNVLGEGFGKRAEFISLFIIAGILFAMLVQARRGD